MFIKCVSDLTIEDLQNNVYYARISLLESNIWEMMLKSVGREQEVVDAVNKINQQGIQKMDFRDRVYYVEKNRIDISGLSTAEKLFLTAKLASIQKRGIIVQGEVGELTTRTLDVFFEEFGSSEFVNVACVERVNVEYYKELRSKYL